MGLRARAVALCALAVVCARAAGYTVDCNHEYTDCESELSKLREDENLSNKNPAEFETTAAPIRTTTPLPTRSPLSQPKLDETQNLDEMKDHIEPVADIPLRPNPRLLNLNDDIQFSNVLHNDTVEPKKGFTDLSDVNLDEDEEVVKTVIVEPKHKKIPDKFYTNLQAPFHALLAMDKSDEVADVCKENNIVYKIGERVEHGCDEVCECAVTGMLECAPRCKHPYIRKSRRLNDPLCFESPVDECCSIITCAGNGEAKPTAMEICKYGNDTYPVGAKWDVGCEKTCECEKNSVVSCKPRCDPLPQSDRCINVQNPHDICCEMQVCDVSQDVHEEPIDNSTLTHGNTKNVTSTTETVKLHEKMDATTKKSVMRPLVLTEPIGSIKVLQNNSVQVNLMHPNTSRDPIHLLLSEDGGTTFNEVMLEYTNLILDLKGGKDYVLKTRETDTKFNFTITAIDENDVNVNKTLTENEDTDMIGCHEDGKFYAVGSEFHIGCSELCECTGHEERECAALECPAQVGLELVWRGCVRWAPSPPASPPACCPRAARCLSDGTCHYKDIAVPNWTEVPISLTGCEKRCFCENGELDCQELCTPLPELPPQSFRCPPMYHPAPVNVSHDDCCKQWGCIPNADDTGESTNYYSIPTYKSQIIYVTPTPISPEVITSHTPLLSDVTNLYKHFIPEKLIPKVLKPSPYSSVNNLSIYQHNKNNTISESDYFPLLIEDESRHEYPNVKNNEVLLESPEKVNVDEKYGILNAIEKTNKMHYLKPTEMDSLLWNSDWNVKTKNISNQSHSDNKNKQLESNKQVNISSKKVQLEKTNEFSMLEQHSINKLTKASNKDHVVPSAEPIYWDIFMKDTEKSNHLESFHLQNNENVQKETNFIPAIKQKPCDEFDSSKKTDDYYLSQHPSNLPITGIDKSHYFKPVSKPYPVSGLNQHILLPGNSYFKPQLNTLYHGKNQSPTYNNRIDAARKLHQTNQFQTNRGSTKGKYVNTIMSMKQDMKPKTLALLVNNPIRSHNANTHVLTKSPNPYQTVLMRAQPNMRTDLKSTFAKNHIPISTKTYASALDLDHFLAQMEIESEATRNIERSAGKHSMTSWAGHATPPMQTQKPFLPTALPDLPSSAEEHPDEETNKNSSDSMESDLPAHPLRQPENNMNLIVINLQSDSPTSVKMLFGLPPVLVGLRGSVDLRYTDKAEEDIASWSSQVFAPADEVLTTSRLEFRLTGLNPSTMYKIRAKLYLHNLPVEPESEIFSIRTKDLPTIVLEEEKRREIDSRLTVVDVNDTTALVNWRHFSEGELEYIDGIQVRYRPVGTPIYIMTELLHHSRSSALLQELRPSSKYEASLVLIPPPRATAELHDPGIVEFNTAPLVDPYNWTVSIEARAVGSGAAELTWRGVPAPPERWVRVYRAAHACDDAAQRTEDDAFRLAARDLPPLVTLTGLKPDTRCRVWLELFLTNGKVKTSNVLEINTKSLDSSEPIDNVVVSAGSRSSGRGDYYGALVAVGVVAALGALTSLLLLLVVVRRHRPRSVPITSVPSAPRESSLPPYDNPAFKLELQQETMDL